MIFLKGKKHILIVDDVTTNLKCIGEILKTNYSLSMVKSGEQALKTLERVQPDLILLDIKMPGMDGFATLDKLRSNEGWMNIPVVLLSADNNEDALKKALEKGAVSFIKKPFVPQDMIDVIEGIFSQKEQ